MVVWVFAGGGESEVAGLIPFLQKNFPGCKFERKTPVKMKPGSKPDKKKSYGKTGKSLITEISEKLPISLQHELSKCDLILVFDDLDCRDTILQKQAFLDAISKIPECADIKQFIVFAAPELESWIIADWNNTIAKHPHFKGNREKRMRYWLSKEKNVNFDKPELFSEYDTEKDACREKLSKMLVESSEQDEDDRNKSRYSKGSHTPLFLREIDPKEVQKKCPLFREFYLDLYNFCRAS
ncbi:DUF4276 family protein [Cronbergia sp. UHCC 0137]|uniref:DUF4276 family protein n=1 Tax=Cronbergia sp. UHCC 0137 TaxID=3110239 RepID=UPI002B202AC2|nr:DUF4276 family protein [Cronbergia sp. UHCC 0137]MEA5618123.1 DUF4276 family protein [Cronbergia sp. UHCC 0137]